MAHTFSNVSFGTTFVNTGQEIEAGHHLNGRNLETSFQHYPDLTQLHDSLVKMVMDMWKLVPQTLKTQFLAKKV